MSVPDVGAEVYPFLPVRLLSRINYDTINRLPKLHCPVLVIHSPDDEIIPYSHGQALFAAANEPKSFMEISGGHNERHVQASPVYQERIKAFISECIQP